MKVKLKILTGSHSGKKLGLPLGKSFIGREPDCRIKCKDSRVSRHHCVLIFEENMFLIRDLESTNGTFVNDQRITGERELKVGDKLQIGPLKFEVLIDHGLGGRKRKKVKTVADALARVAESSSEIDLDVSEFFQEETGSEASASQTTDNIPIKDIQEEAEKQQKSKLKPMLDARDFTEQTSQPE